jgi:hypothetical protein
MLPYHYISFIPPLPKLIIDDVLEKWSALKNKLILQKDSGGFYADNEGVEKLQKGNKLSTNIIPPNILENNTRNNEFDSLGITGSEFFKTAVKPPANLFVSIVSSHLLDIWLNNHVRKYVSGQYYTSVLEFTGGNFFPPHKDQGRKKALNFIVEIGGENVTTDFWVPKAQYSKHKLLPQTVIPYERIDRISSLKMEKHNWYLLDVQKIHSVENIETGKSRIVISVSSDNFEKMPIPLSSYQLHNQS